MFGSVAWRTLCTIYATINIIAGQGDIAEVVVQNRGSGDSLGCNEALTEASPMDPRLSGGVPTRSTCCTS